MRPRGSVPATAVRVVHRLVLTVLVAVVLLLSASSVLTARGDLRLLEELTPSMAPRILPGDLVLYRPVLAQDVRPGDVIGFARAGESTTVTHRVVRRAVRAGSVRLRTRGDANSVADRDPVIFDSGTVVWRVWQVLPRAGRPLSALSGGRGLPFVAGLLPLLLVLPRLERHLRGRRDHLAGEETPESENELADEGVPGSRVDRAQPTTGWPSVLDDDGPRLLGYPTVDAPARRVAGPAEPLPGRRDAKPGQPMAGRALILAGLIVALILAGPLARWVSVTASALSLGRYTSASVSTPQLVPVGLATPAATAPQTVGVSGLSAGGFRDVLLNLVNDGTASVPAVDIEVRTSGSTLLDTDTTTGLTVAVDHCSLRWDQPTPSSAATCHGTTTTLQPGATLATLGAITTEVTDTLAVRSAGGVDHLRLRYALPGGAPGSYSGLSSSPVVNIFGNQLRPGAPTGVALTSGDGQLGASWTAPAATGGPAVSSYTASAIPGGASCTTAGTSCTLTGLTNGITYTVTVRATSSSGAGPQSAGTTEYPYPATLLASGNVPAWFDGSDSSRVLTAGGTAATSGQNVQTWNDRSGNGRNATQATAANQMTVSTLNGRQALLSTATTWYTGSSGTFRTIVAVAYPSRSNIFQTAFAAPANSDFSQRFAGATRPANPNGSDWSSNGADWLNSAPQSITTPPGAAIYVAQSSGAVTNTFSLSTSFLSRGMVGPIGEVIAFNRVLSIAERRSVEEYLSNKWSITPLAPGLPTGVSAAEGGGQVELSWSAPASNGGAAVTGYTVTASPGGATCSSAGTSCTVTGLTNGSNYSFRISATNAAGVGDATPAVTAVPATRPGAPTVLAARGNLSSVVSWSAPASDGGAGITSYTATASPGGATCSTSGTSCTLTGLTNGVAYTVGVAASNAYGAGTAGIATVTPAAAPSPPIALSATPGDTAGAVAWAAPADTGGSPVTGYTATATPADTGLPTVSCTGGAAATGCSLIGLVNGALYAVTATATTALATGDSLAPVDLTAYPAGVISSANASTWLDATDTSRVLAANGTPATSGRNVQTWNDRSGNGHNVAQPTLANQMTQTTLNGRQALRSTATTWFTSTGSGTFRTIMSVANPSRSSTNLQTNFAASANTDFSQRIMQGYHLQSSGTASAMNSNDWANNGNNWTNSVNLKGTPPTAAGIYVSESASTQLNKSFSISTSFLSRGLIGPIGEVIGFNRVLSTTERRSVEEYLARKWSIVIAPGQPSGAAAAAGPGEAAVTWAAPSWNGGSAVSGYTATAAPGGQTCTSTGTGCTIAGLTAGTPYTVTVTAANTVGTGPASAASGSVVPS